MGKIVFVEILDRRGNIRERVKVDSFPITIGRSYSNTVIVDDRNVSEEHLELSLDNADSILIEDLHTLNGTRLFKSRDRIDRHCVPTGGEAVLRIGQTVLRVRGEDFVVGPTKLFSRKASGPFGRFIENRAIAFLLFVVSLSIFLLNSAQQIYKKDIWPDLIGRSFVVLIVFFIWTGFWSFINRLVANSFRFMTHLAISAIVSIVLLLFFTFVEYFEFIFLATTELFRFAGVAVIFSLLLYSHLSVISELSHWKRMVTSALISAGLVGMVLLINYTQRKEFSNDLRFSSVMKPVGQKWIKTVSSREFFGDLKELKSKIDAMAREGPEEKAVKK